MQKLNVKRFVEAISGLENYVPPIEAKKGVQYLYDVLYTKALNGEAIKLADIDFSAFTIEDMEAFEDYFDNTICGRNRTVDTITGGLKRTPPAASKARFI